MKGMAVIQSVLIHVGLICSLVMIVVQILDWYNPFMDFAGHSRGVFYVLCGSSLLHGILHIMTRKKV